MTKKYAKRGGSISKLNYATKPTSSTIQAERLLPNLTESNYEALKHAIDPEELALSGLKIGEEGSIEDKSGNLIFSYGFVDAIEKIIAIGDDEVSKGKYDE